MKKVTVTIAMFLAVLLALGLANMRPVNCADGTVPILEVVDSIDVGSVGEIFNVTIDLTLPPGVNVTNLKGWQIKLGYNTTLLDSKGAQLAPNHPFKDVPGGFQNPPASIDEANGIVSFMCLTTSMDDYVNLTTSATLCNFRFNSTAVGVAYLNFLNVNATGGTYLINNLGTKILVGHTNGTANVIPEFPLVSLLAIFFATTIAAVAIKKKKWVN
jgi:hypothetical protein